MLDDVALFVHIAQCRSLAAAAKRLALPAATVTRRLQRLEDRLGTQLVHRSARKFALTSEGEAYFSALADLVFQAEDALHGLSADMTQLAGGLRVSAPTNASLGVLAPMWSGFLKAFPQIQLTLLLSNDNKDLKENRIDVALRFGPQSDPALYQKRIGEVATRLVASPDYLARHGVPETLDALQGQRLVSVTSLPQWHLKSPAGAQETVYLSATLSVDDITLARQLVSDGHGIALLPVTETAADLEAGRLQTVLSGWTGQVRTAYLVWPTGRLLSARARALCGYIEEFMAVRPVLQGRLPGEGTPQAE